LPVRGTTAAASDIGVMSGMNDIGTGLKAVAGEEVNPLYYNNTFDMKLIHSFAGKISSGRTL